MAEIKLTMDGTLLNWLKQVGDSVNAGDVVAKFEADKATVEVEAPTSGVILQLNAKPGDELREGAVIATMGAASGGTSVPATPAAPVASPPAATAPASAPAPNGGSVAATTEDGRIKASPLARNIAAERGINLAQVQGSGPAGRIVKADIENFTPPAAAAAPQPTSHAAPGILPAPTRKLPEGPDVEIIDVTRMRSRIAASTIESKQQTPHFYVTNEIDMEAFIRLRADLNASLEKEGVKISINDMIVKATALTLLKFPNLNTHYYGDKLARHKHINIGMAVALPNGGLINVVAKDADKTALSVMAVHNKEMIARAQEGKVKPEDIQGATFTVSNLGPKSEVDHFIAVINPPEAGILAIGTARKVPVVLADGSLGVRTRMKVTISVDHRVSDGAEGAAYLQALKELIENPLRLTV